VRRNKDYYGEIMGCDIHAYAEKRDESGKWVMVKRDVFDFRSYGTFAFLAGVRNYSAVTPIAPPRGFPTTACVEVAGCFESWGCGAHTPSWLTIKELSEFDYSAQMEDRRYTKQTGPNSWTGAATCEPGQGERMTWGEFLGSDFTGEVEELARLGAERVVFWFDN
jgi:hypothetical protein